MLIVASVSACALLVEAGKVTNDQRDEMVSIPMDASADSLMACRLQVLVSDVLGVESLVGGS